MTERPQCQACRYWEQKGHELSGFCRCNPPQILPETHDLWPETSAGDWCGKFYPAISVDEGEKHWEEAVTILRMLKARFS